MLTMRMHVRPAEEPLVALIDLEANALDHRVRVELSTAAAYDRRWLEVLNLASGSARECVGLAAAPPVDGQRQSAAQCRAAVR